MKGDLLSLPEDLERYDAWVHAHPQGSLWQSLAWKTFQEALGREVRVYFAPSASALVVIDRTVGGFSTWDIPRGPLGPMENGQWRMDNLLEAIVADATEDRCISLYFSPQQSITVHCPLSIIPSPRHEQPEATRIIDLTLSEEALLAQMHPKGRYNISVAKKHGITIKESDDVDAFYELLQETSKRDSFRMLPKRHYEAFLKHLPGSFLLLASLPGGQVLSHPPALPKVPDPLQPIAGLMGVIWGETGVYYYGGLNYALRAKMAPYLLQWEAMRLCRGKGCRTYDLLGVEPPTVRGQDLPFPDAYPKGPDPTHPWSGVSAFKEKFGGKVVTYPGEQEIVVRPLLRNLLQLKRRIF